MNEQKLDPIKLSQMDVDAFIRRVGALEVTSTAIHATGSESLHPDGLFSERIFGEIGNSARLVQFGWINLNNRFIAPRMYKYLIELNKLYSQIASGSVYAKWNDEIKDFLPCNSEEGKTGYAFLLKHIMEVQPKKNKSSTRNQMIDNLNKYRSVMLIDKMVVLPAGLRDITKKNDRDVYDDINDIYIPILHLAQALKEANNTNEMFNQLRYAMQVKLNDLNKYLFDIVQDKGGYAQSYYGSRNVALGTRNVISATDITSDSVGDPSMLRSDEVLVPLFQAVNMFKPLLAYQVRRMFTEFVFSSDSDSATVVDLDTFESVHATVDAKTKSLFTTSTGINDLIKLFRNHDNKFKPVTVKGADGKEYGLWMLYMDNQKLWLTRSKEELQVRLKESNVPFKPEQLRIITYMELFYITMYATLERYAMVTRFPVTHSDSTLLSKVHLATTSKYNKVTLINPNGEKLYDRWPVIGSDIVGAMSVHTSHLDLYGGDHDGDTVSAIGVLSDEGTEECKAYNDSPRSIVKPNGTPTIGLSDVMSKLMLTSLTMEFSY